MKIGFFDSGVGGLSVLHYALKQYPNNHYLYYADIDHVPYGEKNQQEVIEFTVSAINCLIDRGAQLVVIACNTATSAAIEHVRSLFDIPILGMEPAVKKAIEEAPEGKILTVATVNTIQGGRLQRLLKTYDVNQRVELVALSQLVSWAEEFKFDDELVVDYLKESFNHLNVNEVQSVVLGCTHFKYFVPSFVQVISHPLQFIDGTEGVVKHMINEIRRLDMESYEPQKITIIESGRIVSDKERLFRYGKYLSRLNKIVKK